MVKLKAGLVLAKYGDSGSFQVVDDCSASSLVATLRAQLRKNTFFQKLKGLDADSFSVVTTSGVVLNPEDVIENVVSAE